DALVLMTAHREFRELDLRRVKERMRTPVMIDGRRVFDQSHESFGRVQHFGWTILEQAEGVRGLGFVYRGVGVGNYIHSLFLQSGAP
ncbi:MAG: UDP binding domain-containing protein, partial [Candidatus Methanoperedens sp.]|nr:UDP binding domain-containing protein [Candidatus Methanoperedens sp.]